MRSARRSACLAALLAACGCQYDVADHCAGCAVVEQARPVLPPLRREARALVILVPGGFGFGDEWDKVVPLLRARRDIDFFVFWWRGPWKELSRMAAHLERVMQASIDRLPPGVEVLVLAHSAGAAMAESAARGITVAPGRKVRVAAIAAPADVDLSPWTPEEKVNTPLGFAVGGTQRARRAPAAGVEIVEYLTEDRPREEPRDGRRRVYLGANAGHNRSVELVCRPLIAELLR
jgi:pimeloyl-ACP methyl ester carboxylesterase